MNRIGQVFTEIAKPTDEVPALFILTIFPVERRTSQQAKQMPCHALSSTFPRPTRKAGYPLSSKHKRTFPYHGSVSTQTPSGCHGVFSGMQCATREKRPFNQATTFCFLLRRRRATSVCLCTLQSPRNPYPQGDERRVLLGLVMRGPPGPAMYSGTQGKCWSES